MSKVRITGNSPDRVAGFAVWSVEVLNNDGEWVAVTSCYGPASLSSAILIADHWKAEKPLPCLLDSVEYTQ